MLIVKREIFIALSVLVVVLFHLGLLYRMSNFRALKPDFAGLYEAGSNVTHRLLHVDTGQAFGSHADNSSVQRSPETSPADNLHPPFEMLIFAPLALLKYRVAYLVWYGCNLILLFSVPALLWKYVPHLQKSYPYLIFLISTFFPALVAAVQGQDSILLLFLLTLCFVCLSEGKDFRAGLTLAMGMFKFVLVIPIALGLVVDRRWRTLAGFAAGCVGLLLASIALVGTLGVERYFILLTGFSKRAPETAGTESIMPNLRGFVHALGSGIAPEKWLMGFTLIGSVAILVVVDRRLANSGRLDLRFSAQVLLAGIVSYHLYPHDASVLVLPLLLSLNYRLNSGIRRGIGPIVVVVAIAIYLCPLIASLQVSMPVIFCGSALLLTTVQFVSKSAETRHLELT